MAENIDFIDAVKKMIDARVYEVNTSLPGTVVSYSNGRASIQPTPKRRFSDGDVLPFPIIQNVRVCWPAFSGGSAGVKGPIVAGDKGIIIFAQQAIDGTDDDRRFDISDAYFIPCDLGNAGAGDSGNNADLTMFHGSAYMRLTAGGQLVINAPAGVAITAPTVTNSGSLTNSGAVSMESTLLTSGLATFTTGATMAGIPFASHKHTGVQTGGGTSGGPTT